MRVIFCGPVPEGGSDVEEEFERFVRNRSVVVKTPLWKRPVRRLPETPLKSCWSGEVCGRAGLSSPPQGSATEKLCPKEDAPILPGGHPALGTDPRPSVDRRQIPSDETRHRQAFAGGTAVGWRVQPLWRPSAPLFAPGVSLRLRQAPGSAAFSFALRSVSSSRQTRAKGRAKRRQAQPEPGTAEPTPFLIN